MLQAGQPAPRFSLPDADMEAVDLDAFIGHKNVVLYFYVKDGSPGCTQEAIEFTEAEDQFIKLDTVILGVSPDDCLTHADFRDANGLSVRLLADVEGEVSREYGVWQARPSNGQGLVRYGCQRSTFIIDKDGVVRHALYGVHPRGHVREVLKLVKKL
jgi:thioredoxin-dependent peroxiredoxin